MITCADQPRTTTTPPTESRLATYEKWMKVGLVSANFFTRTERRLIVEREFGVCIPAPRNGKGLVRGGADTRATARGSRGEISLTRHRCPSNDPPPHLCF